MSEPKVTLDAIRDVLGLLDQARQEADLAASAALVQARTAAEPAPGEDGESRAVLVDSAVVRYEVAHAQQRTATLLGLLGGKLLAAIQQEEQVLAGEVAPTIETSGTGLLGLGGPPPGPLPVPFPRTVHLAVGGNVHHYEVPLQYAPWIGEWLVELPPHLHAAAKEWADQAAAAREESIPEHLLPGSSLNAEDLLHDLRVSEDHPDPNAPRVFHDPEPGYGAEHEPYSGNN